MSNSRANFFFSFSNLTCYGDLWCLTSYVLMLLCRHVQLSIHLIQQALLALCIACIFIIHFVTKLYMHPLYDLEFGIWATWWICYTLLTRHFHVVHGFFSVQETEKQEEKIVFCSCQQNLSKDLIWTCMLSIYCLYSLHIPEIWRYLSNLNHSHVCWVTCELM